MRVLSVSYKECHRVIYWGLILNGLKSIYAYFDVYNLRRFMDYFRPCSRVTYFCALYIYFPFKFNCICTHVLFSNKLIDWLIQILKIVHSQIQSGCYGCEESWKLFPSQIINRILLLNPKNCLRWKVSNEPKYIYIKITNTHPLRTPRTKFSIKNEPKTMRGTKYIQLK